MTLERGDVRHLFEWYKSPNPEIVKEATDFVGQFEGVDSLSIYCAGLSALALYTGYEYYCQLSTALFDLGLGKNLPIEKLMPWHVSEDGIRNHVYTVEAASQLSSLFRQRGKKVGFLHGHYRMLTPANWANVLIARERCDLLILGLEDSWRTIRYKGVKPITKDWQRWQWVLASGFDGCLTRISRTSYTDAGYERILKKIKPDIYFGNFSISKQERSEMERRASICNVVYITLPKQRSFSTSELLSR